ncbi:MAG: peptidylprolyl isomerase [Candidatus Cloacimonetes bacterium]|nr:peptidylprolyl isomerase [Candidatus Cloacimonadota bacterium]
MQIVAKVFMQEITKRDVERECSKMGVPINDNNYANALKRLLDKCLLLERAIHQGISITEQEYDDALFSLMDEDEPFGLPSGEIQDISPIEMEQMLRRNLIIRKYIKFICDSETPDKSEVLKEFYLEQPEIFESGESVRCSHILIRGVSSESAKKIAELREQIKSAEDFNSLGVACSDCPSNASCGDLGWFHRGRLIQEIDAVAFSLKLGEISQPFKSEYGYHLLMLTDKKDSSLISYEEIKESLQARMQQVEREFLLSKHVDTLRRQHASDIIIYN